MRNTTGTVVPGSPINGQHSLILSIGMLIVHLQSIIEVLQAEMVRENASSEQPSDDFVILDDISPRHIAGSDALSTSSAQLDHTLHILLDAGANRQAHPTTTQVAQPPS